MFVPKTPTPIKTTTATHFTRKIGSKVKCLIKKSIFLFLIAAKYLRYYFQKLHSKVQTIDA